MTNLQIFELPEMARILELDLVKAKNWTNGRTGIEIQASIRKATGTGTRNLYSADDLYLMGIAREFSKAGFAAKAIGKLLESVEPHLAKLRRDRTVTIWRLKGGGPFQVGAEDRKRPEGMTLCMTFAIGSVLDGIDAAVAKHSGKSG